MKRTPRVKGRVGQLLNAKTDELVSLLVVDDTDTTNQTNNTTMAEKEQLFEIWYNRLRDTLAEDGWDSPDRDQARRDYDAGLTAEESAERFRDDDE